MKAGAAFAFVMLGCIGKPSPLPVPPAEDSFDIGDGKLLVTCRQDDRVDIVEPGAIAGGNRSQAIVRSLPVGFDPYAPDQPHEAVLGPDAFGAGELSWFVTLQQGPRTATAPTDGGAIAPIDCDGSTDPHCAHRGGLTPGVVERYRVHDNAFLGRAQVGLSAAQMAILPDGSKLYATSYDVSQNKCGHVAVINPRTMTTIRVIDAAGAGGFPRSPHGIAGTPDGKLVVVATTWDRIVVVPTDTDDQPATFTVIDAGPDVSIGPCQDVAPPTVITRYQPNTVAMSPDGSRAYVSLVGQAAALVAVDMSRRALDPAFSDPPGSGSVRVGKGPQQVAVTPDGTTVIVPCATDNTLEAVDVATKAHVTLDLARASESSDPFGLSISPDGKHAYVAVGCVKSIGGTCQTPGQGGVLDIPLPLRADAKAGKVAVCGGVIHATYARKQ